MISLYFGSSNNLSRQFAISSEAWGMLSTSSLRGVSVVVFDSVFDSSGLDFWGAFNGEDPQRGPFPNDKLKFILFKRKKTGIIMKISKKLLGGSIKGQRKFFSYFTRESCPVWLKITSSPTSKPNIDALSKFWTIKKAEND